MDSFTRANKRLIDVYGSTVTYASKSEAVYDVETSAVTAGADVVLTTKAAKTSPKRMEVESPNLVNKSTLVYVIQLPDSVKPKPEDVITDAGESFTVMQVFPQMGTKGLIAGYRLIVVKC